MVEEKKINDVVFNFIENMDALNESAPLVLSVVATMAAKLTNAHGDYLEKYGEITKQDEEKKVYSVPVERQGRVRWLREKSSSLRTSIDLIPRNFLVSYVSEFDCFLGSLLRVLYTNKPELLNDSSRQITYVDLLAFESLEDVKEHVLEKEIESVLRKSHSEHFAILENKFNLKLRKDLDIWSDFIEITERRNLFVHANGIVSSQYIKVCSQHGCDLNDISVGDRLTVTSEYLSHAYKVIYEISVKLAHVLWRKLFPDEREEADNSLNNVGFNLILKSKHELAADLLEFSISLPKHHNETIKRMMVINLAQAYLRLDKKDKCQGVLKRLDWSATGYVFKLAVAVLNEENESAAKLLKTVVAAEDLTEEEIVEWPLFEEFRKTEPFLNVFKELFNKDYAEQEELVKEEFKNHMDSVFSIKQENVEETNDDDRVEIETIESTAKEVEQTLEDRST
ncbi:hypothetical protein [Francisella sp. LA112445]|uniref:hypothetical protein n=1 Tax=Francisella sp. LA112445 TaxID=1395624 RepID=UPI001788B1F0|nr:hypothetical protein [Francisella sp. LA112445]QIW10676.1 hypothetical protein FIP56_08160 [Francisella sp. LA112445]